MPTSFNRCQEHPTPFAGACPAGSSVQTVGYVVTIQADGYYALKVEGMSLSKEAARTPVDIHRAVRLRTKKTSIPSSAVDANLPMTGAMLAAKSPLAPATTYNVRVSGIVQATKGGKWVRFKTRTWPFITV